MASRIRNFLFDHEAQVREMKVIGALLVTGGLLYLVMAWASTLKTDTDSLPTSSHWGIQADLLHQPPARQWGH